LRKKIEAAQNEIILAEEDLETALSQIRVARRAEKTNVSDAVERALQRLRSARRTLADLEEPDDV
jgi:hypothetical protein